MQSASPKTHVLRFYPCLPAAVLYLFCGLKEHCKTRTVLSLITLTLEQMMIATWPWSGAKIVKSGSTPQSLWHCGAKHHYRFKHHGDDFPLYHQWEPLTSIQPPIIEVQLLGIRWVRCPLILKQYLPRQFLLGKQPTSNPYSDWCGQHLIYYCSSHLTVGEVSSQHLPYITHWSKVGLNQEIAALTHTKLLPNSAVR